MRSHTDHTRAGWVCPGCDEPARPVPPTTLQPYAAHGLPRPGWSHLDGAPLCPDGASQPLAPVPAAA
jgi:hypothetical protein